MARISFRQLATRLIASRSTPRNRRQPARPSIETLEGRCLPSVTVFVVGRVLHANGDNNGNFVELDHSRFTTVLAGVAVPETTFDSIVINPGNGRNVVQIDGAARSTTVNFGSAGDEIDFGTPVNAPVLLAPINVVGSGRALNYNDQANATPSLTYTLSAGRVQRNGLADVTYSNIVDLTVNVGTAGSHTVNVRSTPFGTSTTVNGGQGNDTFIVGDTNNQLQTNGLLTVNGGGGQNLLSFRDMGTTVASTWGINPTFVNRPLGDAAATLYSNIATLVVSGGSGGNTYVVDGLAPGTATIIAAGSGNDPVHPVTNTVNVGSDGQVFDQGNLTVTGGLRSTNHLVIDDHVTPDAASYSLTGTDFSRNGGTPTIHYSGVQSIDFRAGNGGNVITAANLGSVSTAITTGTGDSVTVFGFQPAGVAVNDPNGTSTLVIDESFLATTQSYTLTATSVSRTGAAALSYAGLASVQLFTSAGADTIALEGSAAGTDTQVWTGAAGNTFRMGAGPFSGPVTLYGGADKLDYSSVNRDVYVNLQTGEATELNWISGIRDVAGGRGSNILVGDGHGNTLTGGFGRNLLIAGGSDYSGQGDTLIGGSDDDILIAGFTDYDTDRASLQAIMALWTGTGFYQDRVAALTTGNGVPLLDATTVHSNQGSNVLLGNAGFDLFYANPGQDRTDADPEAEVTVAIF
jgi:hypothetical protein